MKFKLSNKGTNRIWSKLDNGCLKDDLVNQTIEFDSSDFEGCVLISSELANELAQFINIVDCLSDDIVLNDAERAMQTELNNAIKEGKLQL